MTDVSTEHYFEYQPIVSGLMDELDVPNYRTIDSEDAVDASFAPMLDTFVELIPVDVSLELKTQAAHYVGQDFLRKLAHLETERIARDFAAITEEAGKPLLVMAKIPGRIREDANG